ncbi:MAG: hypothetical protein Q8L52_03135 [bacterium]|nr:hypothetical protein [bacterium]
MLARIPGNYAPVPAQRGDLVGFAGNKLGFILLNPRRTRRGLPRIPKHLKNASILIPCSIEEGESVNFFGRGSKRWHNARLAVLYDIDGKWFYQLHGEEGPRIKPKPLKPDTFMEIGWG